MYEFGVVQSFDPEALTVKVKLNKLDTVTYTMRIIQQFTGKNKTFWVPDINEMVVCILDEGRETGIILGSLYSVDDEEEDNKLPEDALLSKREKEDNVFYRAFEDGTSLKYDRVNMKLTVDVKGDVEETFGDNENNKYESKESSVKPAEKGLVTRTYKQAVTETFEAAVTTDYKDTVDFDSTNDDKVITQNYKADRVLTYEKKLTETFKDEVAVTREKAVTDTFKDDVTASYDKKLTIEVKGDATIKVSGNVTIEGSEVTLKSSGASTINAGGALTVKSSASVSVEGSGEVAVKGAKVTINNGLEVL